MNKKYSVFGGEVVEIINGRAVPVDKETAKPILIEYWQRRVEDEERRLAHCREMLRRVSA